MIATVSARAVETVAVPVRCLSLSYDLLCPHASGWVSDWRISADSSAWAPLRQLARIYRHPGSVSRDILTQCEAWYISDVEQVD